MVQFFDLYCRYSAKPTVTQTDDIPIIVGIQEVNDCCVDGKLLFLLSKILLKSFRKFIRICINKMNATLPGVKIQSPEDWH